MCGQLLGSHAKHAEEFVSFFLLLNSSRDEHFINLRHLLHEMSFVQFYFPFLNVIITYPYMKVNVKLPDIQDFYNVLKIQVK